MAITMPMAPMRTTATRYVFSFNLITSFRREETR